MNSSDALVARAADRSGDAASVVVDGSDAGHEHRWSGVGFTFRDDHPWFLLRCVCGAERSIRAWERYSEPEPEPPADEPMTAVGG